MEVLTFNEQHEGSYLLIELSGPMTAYTVNEFQERLYTEIKDSDVVLDFSKVFEIDLTGMGIIMAAFNDSLEYNTKLYFLNVTSQVQQALGGTGFLNVFNIITSVSEISYNS